MDYVAGNFKIFEIIRVTNMIITKMNNILVYPKRCLSRCKDKLQLEYEDLQGPPLQMVSQVQNQVTSFKQKKSQNQCMMKMVHTLAR